MGISYSEILVISIVLLLFFKPHEIKHFLQNIFSAKKTLETEINSITNEITNTQPNKVEFFDVEERCPKQQ